MTLSLFILTRIISNPLSNVFQKKLTNLSTISPLFIIFITHFLLSLVCLPIFLIMPPVYLSGQFLGYILICAVLAVTGNTLIVAALKSADLSVLGPINAYKSIVSLLPGILILGEFPTRFGITGILLILAGSFFIMDKVPNQQQADAFRQFWKNPGIRLRFAALVVSATEAIFLKKAVQASSPLVAFLFWCMLGVPVAGLVLMVWGRQALRDDAARLLQHRVMLVLLAITTGLMQAATLFTFNIMQVGYSLALFQTSTILSVLFGYGFFQEKNIPRRLVGAIIMVAGAALIITFGS